MDAARFEDFLRSLAETRSRRRVVRSLLSLAAATPLSALLGHGAIDAKKKKRKKKKHKKKERPSCAPDCAGKTCGDDGCGGSCDTCGVQQTCQDGTCLCPDALIICGDACIEGQQCCTDDECTGVTTCGVSHFCTCPNAGDILCSAEACCEPGVAVCPVDRSNPNTGAACQAGGCPASDYCNSETIFRCTEDCVCATSVDGATVCTAGEGSSECVACTHDDECTMALGQPAMCMANGPFCDDFCPGVTAFCVATTCPEDASRRAGNGRTRSLAGGLTDRR